VPQLLLANRDAVTPAGALLADHCEQQRTILNPADGTPPSIPTRVPSIGRDRVPVTESAGAMRAKSYFTAVDSHTEGMPTRVITGGLGPLPGDSMQQRRLYFQDHLDELRLML